MDSSRGQGDEATPGSVIPPSSARDSAVSGGWTWRRVDYDRKRFQEAHAWLDRVVVVLVAASPLALGGTHPSAAAALATLMLLALAASATTHARHRARWRWQPLALLCFGLAVWALVRALPGTGWLGGALARDVYAAWPDVAARASLAPGRAGLWALKTCGLGAAIQFAAQRFSHTRHLGLPGVAVLGAGLVVVTQGVLQLASGTGVWFGAYTPLDWDRVVPMAGAFVNPNQAGAVTGLAAVVAACHGWRSREVRSRLTMAVLTLLLLLYTVALDARGAALAAGVALVSLPLLFPFAQRAGHQTARAATAAWVTFATLAGMAALYVALPRLGLWADSTLGIKLRIWRESLAGAAHVPLTGVGAVGFQDAFPSWAPWSRHEWVTDPEAGPLQLLVEHGIPVLLVVAVAIAAVAWRATRRESTTTDLLLEPLAAVTLFVLLESVTGMGMHAMAYLLGVGLVAGVLSGRADRARERGRAQAPEGAQTPNARTPIAGTPIAGAPVARTSFAADGASVFVSVICATALVTAPGSIAVSLADSRVPFEALVTSGEVPDRAALDRQLRAAARRRPAHLPVVRQAALLYAQQADTARARELADLGLRLAPRRDEAWVTALRVAAVAGDGERACALTRERARLSGFVDAELLLSLDVPAEQLASCLPDAGHVPALLDELIRRGQRDTALAVALLHAEGNLADEVALRWAVVASEREAPELAAFYARSLLEVDRVSDESRAAVQRFARRTARWDLLVEATEPWAQAQPQEVEAALDAVQGLLEPMVTDESLRTPERRARIAALLEASERYVRGDRQRFTRWLRLTGDVAWTMGEADAAQAAYEQLVRRDGERRADAVVLYRLGELARERGALRDAQRLYQRALDARPGFREAQQGLERIGG